MYYKKFTDKKVFFHGNSLFHLGPGNVFYQFAVSTKVRSLMNPVPTIQDYSYQGKRTTELTSEFSTVVAPYVNAGDIVIFWDGTNDMSSILGNQSAAQALINTKAYFTQAEALGLTVRTMTCIPRNVTSLDDTRRLTYNSSLLADGTVGNKVWDPCALTQFDAYADVNNSTYYNADLVHLTQAGYDLIAGVISTPLQLLL